MGRKQNGGLRTHGDRGWRLDFDRGRDNLAGMSVAELQKTIRGLSVEDRRTLARIAARMARNRRRATNEKAMRSVLGCAKRIKPGKSSRQILVEMRGYDRGDL